MFLYFYLLEQNFFQEVMAPALAESFRKRSFAVCRELCREIIANNFQVASDSVIRAIEKGLPFDSNFWHALVGECLVYGAKEIPRLDISADTLCCLLARSKSDETGNEHSVKSPIENALFGTHDLLFGGSYYRPDYAAFNDLADINRLRGYLESVDPSLWSAGALASLGGCCSDVERLEELEDARASWPDLLDLYKNAQQDQCIIVCERI